MNEETIFDQIKEDDMRAEAEEVVKDEIAELDPEVFGSEISKLFQDIVLKTNELNSLMNK